MGQWIQVSEHPLLARTRGLSENYFTHVLNCKTYVVEISPVKLYGRSSGTRILRLRLRYGWCPGVRLYGTGVPPWRAVETRSKNPRIFGSNPRKFAKLGRIGKKDKKNYEIRP